MRKALRNRLLRQGLLRQESRDDIIGKFVYIDDISGKAASATSRETGDAAPKTVASAARKAVASTARQTSATTARTAAASTIRETVDDAQDVIPPTPEPPTGNMEGDMNNGIMLEGGLKKTDFLAKVKAMFGEYWWVWAIVALYLIMKKK